MIADALRRARAEGTSRIGEEHMLAALLGNPDSRPLLGGLAQPGSLADALAARGITLAGELAVMDGDGPAAAP